MWELGITTGKIESALATDSGDKVTTMDLDTGKIEVRDDAGTLRVLLGQLA